MFQVGSLSSFTSGGNQVSYRQRISNLTKFEDNYDWGGLESPLPIIGISEFGRRNDVNVNVLGEQLYTMRKSSLIRTENFELN